MASRTASRSSRARLRSERSSAEGAESASASRASAPSLSRRRFAAAWTLYAMRTAVRHTNARSLPISMRSMRWTAAKNTRWVASSASLGESYDVPFEYTGSYHEQVVDVRTEPIQVDLSSTPPLPVQNTTRIAILPIRQTNNCTGPLDDVCLDPPDGSNIGVLKESDIAQFEAQTQAIVDEWLKPFSYGLMSFDIDVLPVVEDLPLANGLRVCGIRAASFSTRKPRNRPYRTTTWSSSSIRSTWKAAKR